MANGLFTLVSQSLSAKTETTATIKWASDAIVDYIWYSTNDGSSWSGIDVVDSTGGSYIISGLSANTTYNIKTRVRSKDSQLTTDSSTLAVTTYAYPYANSMPNFQIGNNLTIGLYNPLGRQITVNVLGADNSQCSSDTTFGTSITGYSGSEILNALYASIPNAQSGIYKVKVTYGTQISILTGGTYSVNPNVCSPSIGSVAYADINPRTIALTNNAQDIVRNHSTVRYTVNGLVANNSATVSSCSVTVNGATYSLSVSGSSASGIGGVINSGTSLDAVFTVTDSRGLTGTKTVTISMLDWTVPSAIVNLQRQDNFYTATDLIVDANYASINGNNQITITYQATKEGDSSPTVSGSVQDNVTSVVNLDNNFAWTVVVTLADSLGGTTSYNLYISRGMPIIYFDRLKSSVGVNCFPQNNKSFEINGQTIFDMIYPVGSIYMSVNSTSPATLFGGTWSQIKDKFLLACGDTYSNGATGGEATVTLTTQQMPSHSHDIEYSTNGGSSYTIGKMGRSGTTINQQYFGGTDTVAPSQIYQARIKANGGGQAHNNMPPYLCVYIWRRTN